MLEKDRLSFSYKAISELRKKAERLVRGTRVKADFCWRANQMSDLFDECVEKTGGSWGGFLYGCDYIEEPLGLRNNWREEKKAVLDESLRAGRRYLIENLDEILEMMDKGEADAAD